MASWTGDGGGGTYTPPTAYTPPGSAAFTAAARGVTKKYEDWLDDYLEKSRYNPTTFNNPSHVAPLINQSERTNLQWIIDHPPLKKGEKTIEQRNLDWMGNLLLDLVGYGSAIAQFVPVPAIRVSGTVASHLSRAARMLGRGQIEGGFRELGTSARKFNYWLGSDSRRSGKGRKNDRK